MKSDSLRSKRFQSSYCAKVGGRAKKKWKGEGSYTNFDNFVGELSRKACAADQNSNNFSLDESKWTVLVLDQTEA